MAAICGGGGRSVKGFIWVGVGGTPFTFKCSHDPVEFVPPHRTDGIDICSDITRSCHDQVSIGRPVG